MECLEAIKGRRSIRKFKNTPIEKDIIEELLKAAQMAPSAGNLQAYDFIVVTNEITKEKLSKASLNQSFIKEAPIVIVVTANIERSSRRYKSRGEFYAIQDATAGTMNLLLAAYSKGLGTCWVGAYDEYEVAEILSIPLRVRPIAIIAIGYPDESPFVPPRMKLDKIVHWEIW